MTDDEKKEPEFPNYGKEFSRNVDEMKQRRWMLSTGKYLHTCTHMLYMNQARPHTHAHIFSCQRSGQSKVVESQKFILSIPALLPKRIRTSGQIANNFFSHSTVIFKTFQCQLSLETFSINGPMVKLMP